MHLLSIGALLWLLVGIDPLAYAEEYLEVVEVKSAKDLSSYQFGSINYVSSEELNRSGDLLSRYLNSQPFLFSSQNGGPGSRATYYIRGTESRHLLYTLDGLKLNDSSNVDRQFDAAFLTNSLLSEMTIFLGPQSVLFGSDALGGLIDMTSRKGENAPEARLKLATGSFGTASSSFSKDWNKSNSRGTLTWSGFRTDGISRLNEKRYRATERDGSQINQLTSSSRHDWHSRFQSDFLVSYINGSNELDGNIADNSFDNSKNDQYLIQQKTNLEIDKRMLLVIRNGLSRHQREIKSLSFDDSTFSGNLYQNELLLNLNFRSSKFVLGTSLEDEKLNQEEINRSVQTRSVFVQSLFKFNSFSYQLGQRLDGHGIFGDYLSTTSGIKYNFSSGHLGIQYSKGFKAPTLYQLYAKPILGTPIGNKNLIPEKNNSIEASLKIKWAELSVYKNKLSDLITFSNRGFLNLDEFTAEGVELKGNWSSEKVSLKPFVGLIDFKGKKNQVLRRPTQSRGFDLFFYPHEKWELFSAFRWFSSRMDLDGAGKLVKLNGFETFNAGIRYFRSRDEFGLQWQNLTGE